MLEVDVAIEEGQKAALRARRTHRDNSDVNAHLESVSAVARSEENLMSPNQDCPRSRGHGRRGLRCPTQGFRSVSTDRLASRTWFMTDFKTHMLIIGAGPAGTQAATTAASKGARVTLVEKDIVGGAAHLWDCIPSKTMAASALRRTSVRNAVKLGLDNDPGRVDPVVLSERINEITSNIHQNLVELLDSQQVEILRGTGRFTGPNEAVVTVVDGDRTIVFDQALISTGSAPTHT